MKATCRRFSLWLFAAALAACLLLAPGLSARATEGSSAPEKTADLETGPTPEAAPLEASAEEDVPAATSSPIVVEVGDREPRIQELLMARSVKDLIPQGVGAAFPGTVKKLYCFMRVTDAGKQGQVLTHVWFYKDRATAKVRLKVQGPNFRTFSSKNIPRGWSGPWRVDVVNDDGKILGTADFTIE